MNLVIGVVLTILAGVLAGNCMLPLKFLGRWKWENAWLVFTVVSLVILPWGLAITLTENLISTYASLSLRQLAIPMGFGFGLGHSPGDVRALCRAPWARFGIRGNHRTRRSSRNARTIVRAGARQSGGRESGHDSVRRRRDGCGHRCLRVGWKEARVQTSVERLRRRAGAGGGLRISRAHVELRLRVRTGHRQGRGGIREFCNSSRVRSMAYRTHRRIDT